MENEIELADVFKAAIQSFDKDLDEIEDAELAFCLIDKKDEVQGGVVAIDYTDAGAEDGAAFHEIAEGIATLGHYGEDIAN